MKTSYQNLFILFIIISLQNFDLFAQECTTPFARTFGSLIDESRGYCVVASPEEHVVYIGGLKNDSVSIIRLNAAGDLEWIHTFDIEAGEEDNLNGIILDSDGMLGLAGSSGSFSGPGTVFVFRYDPNTNTVLWAKQVTSTSENYCSGLIEMGPGGNYLLFNNPVNPNDAELLELDRNSGNLNPDFSKHYHLGSSETISDIVFHNDKLYASARWTDGGGLPNMRNTLVKMDVENGDVDWALLGHRPASASARLYTIDLVIHEDKIYSIVAGDADGTSVDFTQVFIQKTSLDGNVEWLKQYELPAQNDWVDEIIVSDEGLVVLGRNRVAPSDIYLFKVNTDGDILWSWSFDFAKNDNSVSLGGVTSQLAELDGYIYFTAGSEKGAQLDMLLVKTNLQGELSDSCGIANPIHLHRW